MIKAMGMALIWLLATGTTLPEAGPKPMPRPDLAKPEAPEAAEPIKPAADKPAIVIDQAAPAETPGELEACLKDLRAIGATFSLAPAITEPGGCGMAHPLTVTGLLADVTLEPEATLRCETALNLARMTRDLLQPAARAAFPDKPKLSAIRHASAYVCKKRNGADGAKISEHARGNAVDIAGLRFGDEEWPLRIAKAEDGTADAAFQRSLNALACLYFTTVLSPGSDATHQSHLHLDVIKRRGGFRYCR